MAIDMGATFDSKRRSHIYILVIGLSASFSLTFGQITTAPSTKPISATTIPSSAITVTTSALKVPTSAVTRQTSAVTVLTSAVNGSTEKPSYVPTNVLTYDCRRAGAFCLNDYLCNDVTGRCDCDEGLNFFCKNISTKLSPVDCGECLHGVCTNSSGTNECVCYEGYYGPGCYVPRVDVECNDKNMVVYINPYVQFDGEIFVSNGNLTLTVKDTCKFIAVNGSVHGNHTKGLYLVLDHISDDCGNATLSEEHGFAHNLNYTRQFFLEYVKKARTDTDQMITVSCDFTPRNKTTLNASVIVQDIHSETNNVDVYKDTSVRMEFTVTAKGGSISDNFVLGQEIDLKFVMTTNEQSAFGDFIISSCEVKNCGAGKENISITLIRGECPTTEALPLITKNINTVANNQRTVTESMSMRAFVFLGESNSTLNFECTVELCDRACTHQVQPCQSSTKIDPSHRKRRAAENEKKVSAQITVVDPGSQIKGTSDLMTQDCLQQPSLIAIISTLGVLVLLLLTLCIILILRLLKSSKNQTPPDSASMPMYELRIPRTSLTPANGSYHYN